MTTVARSRAGLVAAAVLAILLPLTGCGLFRGVDGMIEDTYARAADLDDGTARAFTSADPPSGVLSRISAAEPPLGTVTHPWAKYLQYRDWIVRIAPAATGTGSLILLDDYASGYVRWGDDVASAWGAVPPGDDDGK